MQKVDYESLKTQLLMNEKADFEYQKRRHEQWTENYQLYRDKVIINRLTQRQSINVPLIKGTVKTILSNTDQFDDVEFEEKGNNKDKQIAFNELWKDFVVTDKLEVKDNVDIKQVLLYGRTWTNINIVGGRLTFENREPFDVLVDRYMDPSDLETANHLTDVNIFRTIGQLEANPSYSQEAIKAIRLYFGTAHGLIKATEITQISQATNQRLEDMGVPDINHPQLGDTIVELKVYWQKMWDLKDQQDHWHVIVACNCGLTNEILMAKPLMDIMGIDFIPKVTWADDIERNDFYSDGVADIARTTNKLLNSMISSLAENRILRNFGMQYYDATAMENWSPAGFDPVPFGWYGVPGKPQDVVQRVEIPDQTEAIDEMQYVKTIVEAATAATSTIQGDTTENKVTLGEVQLTVAAAKERISSISKFKLLAQKEKADKWARIMNANPKKLDAVKLYKKSSQGNYFAKTVAPSDWQSADGYSCRVVSSAEKDKQNTEGIQKISAVAAQFPNNPVMKKIYQKKLLDFGDVNPDDQQAVLEYEDQMQQAMMQQQQAMAQAQAQPQPMDQALQQQSQALQTLTPAPNG
jgi:hypothetical protein